MSPFCLHGRGAELDFNMQFDFTMPSFKEAAKPKRDGKAERQFKVENILNLGYAQFPGAGEYDIPIIEPVHEIGMIDEWVKFENSYTVPDPEDKGLIFFSDDYQFERVWNNPNRYIDRLRRFKAVLSPDFSPYGDMPLATQIFNHYRKHWCAAYWQMHGVTVIPTIRASTDPRSLDFYLDGEPKGGIVAFSTMWSDDLDDEMQEEFHLMVEALNPCKVLIYGRVLAWIKDYGIPIQRIRHFSQTWREG